VFFFWKLPKLEALLAPEPKQPLAPRLPEVQLAMIRLHHALMGGNPREYRDRATATEEKGQPD
jgi:hypothetical protein